MNSSDDDTTAIEFNAALFGSGYAGLGEDHAQAEAATPGDWGRAAFEAGFHEDGIVRTLVEDDVEFALGDLHAAGGIQSDKRIVRERKRFNS